MQRRDEQVYLLGVWCLAQVLRPHVVHPVLLNQAKEPGGGGINVARAINQLGGQAVALYTAGGVNGQLLEQLLQQHGVRHQPIAIAGDTRQSFTLLEESSTMQYRFNLPGPTLDQAEAGLKPAPLAGPEGHAWSRSRCTGA